jgi:signal transduction histidine kinase
VLYDFLIDNRDEILGRSREKLAARHVPTPTELELKHGLPLFLDQIIMILRAEKGQRDEGHHNISTSAGVHGRNLLRMGLTIGQVVQDYGSICQSVMELADERDLAIEADEFQTFNRCLDEAIAQAVTTYEQDRDRAVEGAGAEHLGFLAHEMRNLLTTSLLTFDTLVRGTVGIQGSTGTLLGRSLRRMRTLVDRTLAEVRLEGGNQHPDHVVIAQLLEEIQIVSTIDARDHKVQLSIDYGPPDAAVNADCQILASVVANLVQNALKFTPSGGHITIRAYTIGERVLIDVEDECGGLPPGKAEDLFRPFNQRGADKSGLGLGLSISVKGVRASGGEIHVHDRPGLGCIFTVDLPRAPAKPFAPAS